VKKKFKEHEESQISEMRRDQSETAAAISDGYRGTSGDI